MSAKKRKRSNRSELESISQIDNLYVIDTNVLVLLIIGMTDPSLIEKHKKSGFTAEDYYILLDFLGTDPAFLLLPHVVAETSSLLGLIGGQYKRLILKSLQRFLMDHEEHYVPSRVAARRIDFNWRGATDCAIIEFNGRGGHLLTADALLYEYFLSRQRPVTNFRHVIENAS